MLFNSIEFAIFLPLVFVLYWFVTNRNLKFQNALIVVSSFVFYGWWDWRFLFLLLFSSLMDFCIGIWLNKMDAEAETLHTHTHTHTPAAKGFACSHDGC